MTYGGSTYGGTTYGGTSDARDVQVLQPQVNTLQLNPPTPTITGDGDATLTPQPNTLQFEPIGVLPDLDATTGGVKTGEYPTGGSAGGGLQLLSKTVFRPAVNTLQLDPPTPDITGEGTATLTPTVNTLQLDPPTPQIGFDTWVIAGEPVTRVTAETTTNTTLSVTYRVTTSTLDTALRPLKSDEGKLDVVPTDDGGYQTIDRANGNNTYTITPPITRVPLRQQGPRHVQRYEETLVSQEVGEWTVELELARDANRTDTPAISESPAADEWGFQTRYGEIATARVDADLLGTGDEGVQRYELEARLTFAEAHVFEAAFARLGAGRVRELPDAPNEAVDDSSNDVVTVTVDAPDSQSIVSDGDYIVTSWESTRLSGAYQSVTFTIASL